MFARVLMIASAVFLAALGVATSFFTREVLAVHGTEPDGPTLLLIQMMGALYLGFAVLNWGARGVIIGGIYARPVSVGNFVHFLMVALMLAREAVEHQVPMLAASAVVFGLFAAGFARLVFRPQTQAAAPRST